MIEHWQTLQQQLQQAAHNLTSAVIVEATATEQHACRHVACTTPPRRHCVNTRHFDMGRHRRTRSHIVYKPEQHSIDGMPQCRHCQVKLYNWQALKGHIMLNVCNWYRPSQPDTVMNDPHQKEPVLPETQDTDAGTPVQQEAADIRSHVIPRMSGSPPPKMLTLAPYLQRPQVVQQLCTHEGIITQANLHRQHLTQHCGFCQRWIAEPA